MNDRATALSFFTSMGWTPAQSAGIVANLIAESGLNPNAVGDGGLAYGIAQWHPDRQANFRAIIGRDIRGSSFEDQLAFVNAELNGFEKPAGDALRACSSAAEAGACVSKLYERPADREGEALKRGRLAEQLLASHDAGAPIIPVVAPTPSSQPQGAPMDPLSLLSLLGAFIPQVMTLIKPESKSMARDAALAQTILNTAAQAAGVIQQGQQATATAVGQTVDAMNRDPTLIKKVQEAVVTHPEVIEELALREVGGGPTAIRAAEQYVDNRPWWVFLSNASFWAMVFLTPTIYMVVYKVLWSAESSEQLKTVVVTAVLSGIAGALTGFFFGSAYSSTRTTKTTSTAGGSTTATAQQ